MKLPDPVEILGVPVIPLRVAVLHEWMDARLAAGQRAEILNVNVHALNLAYRLPWLRAYLRRAPLVFCDGAGVILGARMLGRRIPERITYADWMWQLAGHAAQKGYRLYFLGALPGVAETAARTLQARFPALQVVGWRDGYFDRTPGSPANAQVIAEINRLDVDILVLGMGMPLQERWLMENWPDLTARIGLTGGAVFDYLSGRVKRAPDWMNRHSLEWLGRLLIEPARLWQRYLLGNPLFLLRVLAQRLGVLKLPRE